jgi:hypothetical protein
MNSSIACLCRERNWNVEVIVVFSAFSPLSLSCSTTRTSTSLAAPGSVTGDQRCLGGFFDTLKLFSLPAGVFSSSSSPRSHGHGESFVFVDWSRTLA